MTVSVGKKVAVGVSNRVAAGVNTSTELSSLIGIKSYFGLSQPGGVAAIAGQNFGTQQGRVVANLKMWNGDTNNVPLTVKAWRPTLIEVEWPAGIDGVRDQTDAVVEVTHANNTSKASWKVFFRAEADYRLLEISRVRVVTCGDDANTNSCNNNTVSKQFCWDTPSWPQHCTGSFKGVHHNCWGTVGNDSGTDEYEVRLKNDWVISSVDFKKNAPGGGAFERGAVWDPSPPASIGSAAWNARVKWEVTPNDTISYCAFIHIRGPKGVPY